MTERPNETPPPPATAPLAEPNTEISSPGDATLAGTEAGQTPALDELRPGSQLGVYRLEQKLGEGGMGTVWKAQHIKLGKTVALKVLPQRLTRDAGLVTRFEREMKAVGLLDHPHIVRAMDAGEIKGTHFLVMEYADGIDFAGLVRSHGPRPVREACEIVRQAALGLGYAHQHGLIHRDIKPTNLFLTKNGNVKILDLGLARLQGDHPLDDPQRGTLTTLGQILGTPDYMASEQWDDTHSVDGRADLYALGCTLFYLLTGRPPFGDAAHHSMGKKLAGHTFEAIPDLRSARQAGSATGSDDIPDAVDAIYRRLMAKRPEDRFQSADELVRALNPLVTLDELPTTVTLGAPEAKPIRETSPTMVSAEPAEESSAAKLAHFFQTVAEPTPAAAGKRSPAPGTAPPTVKTRHVGWYIAGGAAGLLLIVGLASQIKFSNDNRIPISPATEVKPSDPKAEQPVVKLPGQPVLVEPGAPLSPLATVPFPAPIAGLRSWSIELATQCGEISALVWSPTGRVIATGDTYDGSVRLWDTEGGLRNALYGHRGGIQALSFSRDGKLLASGDSFTGRNANPAEIRVWDVATGTCVAVVPIPSGDLISVAFSPVNDELAFTSAETLGIATIDGRPVRTRGIPGILRPTCSWSADGESLVCSQGIELGIYDARKLELTSKLSMPAQQAGGDYSFLFALWSPDGKRIVAVNYYDGTVHVWDADERRYLKSFETGYQSLYSLCWHRNSRWVIASGVARGGWRIYDAFAGKPLTGIDGIGGRLAAWSPDGKEVVLWTSSLTFFDELRGRQLRQGSYRGRTSSGYGALSADGTRLVVSGFDGSGVTRSLPVFDAQTGELEGTFGIPTSLSGGCYSSLSPRGDRIAARYVYGVVILDSKTGSTLRTLTAGDIQLISSAWSPEGTFFAATCDDKTTKIWDVATGKLVRELVGHDGAVQSVAWSPDGTRIATIGSDNLLKLWDAATGELLETVREYPVPPYGSMFYNPGGQRFFLAWTSDSRELWINLTSHITRWNAATKEFSLIRDFPAEHHVEPLTPSMALSPDGKRLLAESRWAWTFLQEEGAEQSRLLGPSFGATLQWHADSRRFLSQIDLQRFIAADATTNRRLGTLFPAIGEVGRYDYWLCVGPTGHYRGRDGVEQHIIYAAQFEDGHHETFTPAEFREKIGWKNDPDKATLLKLDE